MGSSLTCIGVVWALMSLLSAITSCVGFFMPYWLLGSQMGKPVSFGTFRRCSYPVRDEIHGGTVMIEHCGRYASFLSIPSLEWRICTVVTGSGCGLLLLVALTALMGCCVTDIISRTIGRAAGGIQLVGEAWSNLVLFHVLLWGFSHIRVFCGRHLEKRFISMGWNSIAEDLLHLPTHGKQIFIELDLCTGASSCWNRFADWLRLCSLSSRMGQ